MAVKVPPMREIRLPNVPSTLNMLFSRCVAPRHREREYLTDLRSARRIKIEHRLQTLPRDRLHWHFVASTSGNKLPLASMRNHYQRKWNDAFGKALKANGFDYHGKKLPSSPDQLKEVGLTGTLEIRLYNAAHWNDNNPGKMIQHSSNIVKGLRDFLKSGLQRPVIHKRTGA